ncbi:D-arabinono-1,4-lactone oxidase [Elasticomyces elasticus]|nr:D-arabinono-1,4-lactone oxidase [Elasticomyces elasticus]KAK4989740.1 D-arabinono-1,4-lactone oxidase [Elasticomyces elasticus]
MDEHVAYELSKLDSAVHFRASTSHVHHTWAKTFQSRPELYLRPQSLEEIQKIITLARRCRKRLVVVGCGHSPSDLTCTSSWMINLDQYSKVLNVDLTKNTLTVEGGIRLRDLNLAANRYGLTMPNLGSIDEQSIAGAIATATHGSSLKHGLMSESVKSLRIVLSNGSAVRCSAEQNTDLFRAALVSLGALGIIVEIEYQMIPACNIEWEQTLRPLSDVLSDWDKDLWTQKEYTRVWWLPYMKRAIVWSATKTDHPIRQAESNWYGGSVGFHTYHILLWLSNYLPRILPTVEWFVFGMQYGFSDHSVSSAVEPLRTGLLMNCLYSQFVNEWALPLSKGPEAITRLSAWINGDEVASRIPFSSRNLYVHAPVEVRVSDASRNELRPYLDNTNPDGPTLYLNATLYRPYLQDPPCKDRYYEAFEWLMRDLGGKPHWAKNFSYTSQPEIAAMYGENLESFLRIRNEVDPEGMFLGEWHRRSIIPASASNFALEEREVARTKARDGGQIWVGEIVEKRSGKAVSPSSSDESFSLMHGAEAQASVVLPRDVEEDTQGEEEDSKYGSDRRKHGNPREGVTGTEVFDKM